MLFSLLKWRITETCSGCWILRKQQGFFPEEQSEGTVCSHGPALSVSSFLPGPCLGQPISVQYLLPPSGSLPPHPTCTLIVVIVLKRKIWSCHSCAENPLEVSITWRIKIKVCRQARKSLLDLAPDDLFSFLSRWSLSCTHLSISCARPHHTPSSVRPLYMLFCGEHYHPPPPHSDYWLAITLPARLSSNTISSHSMYVGTHGYAYIHTPPSLCPTVQVHKSDCASPSKVIFLCFPIKVIVIISGKNILFQDL